MNLLTVLLEEDNYNTMKTFFTLFILGLPQVLFAASGGSGGGFRFDNPIGATNFPELIYKILDAVVKLGAVFVVLFIVYAGYKFVTAQGNPAEISAAKSILFYTLIGAVILLGAEAIAQVVCNTANDLGAGVQCLGRR